MTAKEKLRERVEALSEQEAAETLRLLDEHDGPLARRLDKAPLEDEKISPEEQAAVQEARDAAQRELVILRALPRGPRV